jgi:hypothetical protein
MAWVVCDDPIGLSSKRMKAVMNHDAKLPRISRMEFLSAIVKGLAHIIEDGFPEPYASAYAGCEPPICHRPLEIRKVFLRDLRRLGQTRPAAIPRRVPSEAVVLGNELNVAVADFGRPDPLCSSPPSFEEEW